MTASQRKRTYDAAWARSDRGRKLTAEAAARWRANNPEKYRATKAASKAKSRAKDREYMVQWKFGISVDETVRMLTEQSGGCRICGTPISFDEDRHAPARAQIDHCHKNGHVRGILCRRCNRLLGMANDKPELLARCIAYLRGDAMEPADPRLARHLYQRERSPQMEIFA